MCSISSAFDSTTQRQRGPKQIKQTIAITMDHQPRDKEYKGLKNHGATCYLNSVLQVLFMTRDFRKAVQSYNPENPATADHIDHQLKHLFDELSNHVTGTYDIIERLGIDQVRQQRDAADYFEKILNLSSGEASKIFQGKLTHRNTCLVCKGETNANTPFWHLPLALTDPSNSGYSVVDGVKQFFHSEVVGGENQLYCDCCEKKAETKMECLIDHHPDVLTLLLKRFEFDWSYMTYMKINHSVEIPLTLQLPKAQTYELYAFVEHTGSLWGGHYTAMIRSQEGQDGRWYKFDDSWVTLAQPQPFQRESKGHTEKSDGAYLLFYKKLDQGADACNENTEEMSTPEAPQVDPSEDGEPRGDAEQVTDEHEDAHPPEEFPSGACVGQQARKRDIVQECPTGAKDQEIEKEYSTGGTNNVLQKTPDICDSEQERSGEGWSKSVCQGGKQSISKYNVSQTSEHKQAGYGTWKTSVETTIECEVVLGRLVLNPAQCVHGHSADGCNENREGTSAPEAPQVAPSEDSEPQEDTERVRTASHPDKDETQRWKADEDERFLCQNHDWDAEDQHGGGLENEWQSKSEDQGGQQIILEYSQTSAHKQAGYGTWKTNVETRIECEVVLGRLVLNPAQCVHGHSADGCNENREGTSAPEAPQVAPSEDSEPQEDTERVRTASHPDEDETQRWKADEDEWFLCQNHDWDAEDQHGGGLENEWQSKSEDQGGQQIISEYSQTSAYKQAGDETRKTSVETVKLWKREMSGHVCVCVCVGVCVCALSSELTDLLISPVDHSAVACIENAEETSAPEAPQVVPSQDSEPGGDAEQVTEEYEGHKGALSPEREDVPETTKRLENKADEDRDHRAPKEKREETGYAKKRHESGREESETTQRAKQTKVCHVSIIEKTCDGQIKTIVENIVTVHENGGCRSSVEPIGIHASSQPDQKTTHELEKGSESQDKRKKHTTKSKAGKRGKGRTAGRPGPGKREKSHNESTYL